ncbi:unnamed protein product [Rotaria magnacalcarata]|uniref:Uncharacterized protein n=1 Tax=Rotaria magnacalcarata TaxID=392030 RepID=A0A816U5A9_9BILA|nr:unnamed protein product [Rotaria magnacalcarata]
MLFMFLVFTLGWAPTYLIRLPSIPSNIVKTRSDFRLSLLSIYSLLMNLIIVYYKNSELRNHIRIRLELQPAEPIQKPTTANNKFNAMSTARIYFLLFYDWIHHSDHNTGFKSFMTRPWSPPVEVWKAEN